VLFCGLESDFLAGTACLEHCASYLTGVRVNIATPTADAILWRTRGELVVDSAFFRKMVVLSRESPASHFFN